MAIRGSTWFQDSFKVTSPDDSGSCALSQRGPVLVSPVAGLRCCWAGQGDSEHQDLPLLSPWGQGTGWSSLFLTFHSQHPVSSFPPPFLFLPFSFLGRTHLDGLVYIPSNLIIFIVSHSPSALAAASLNPFNS